MFVSATIDVSRRGRAASWYGGLYRVGGVLGPLLGAAVAEAWSSRGALLLQTVWMVAAALAVILWFPRQPIGVRAARAGLPSTNSKPVQPIAPPSDVNSVTSDANSGPSATDAAPTGDESVVVQATPPGWRQTNACWNSHVMRIFRQYWYQLFTVGVFSALLQFIREARPLVFPLAGDSFGMSKTEIGLVRTSRWHARAHLRLPCTNACARVGRRATGAGHVTGGSVRHELVLDVRADHGQPGAQVECACCLTIVAATTRRAPRSLPGIVVSLVAAVTGGGCPNSYRHRLLLHPARG